MSGNKTVDKLLDLAALNAGKQEAFCYLYEQYYQSLCLFASRLVDIDEAEDVVHEVFLMIWKKRKHFENEDHVKSFLYLSTRNTCLNVQKANRRAGERQSQFVFEREDWEESCLFHMFRAEVLRELREAVYRLPPKCQKVIKLTYLEGKSNPEVAAELNISIHTVKNQKQRGLELLRHKLDIQKEYLILLLPLLGALS